MKKFQNLVKTAVLSKRYGLQGERLLGKRWWGVRHQIRIIETNTNYFKISWKTFEEKLDFDLENIETFRRKLLYFLFYSGDGDGRGAIPVLNSDIFEKRRSWVLARMFDPNSILFSTWSMRVWKCVYMRDTFLDFLKIKFI